MKLTICEYKGNFVSGNSDDLEQTPALEASIASYCVEVVRIIQATAPEMEVEFDLRNGEGDPSRHHVVEFNDDDDDPLDNEARESEKDDILFTIDAIREKVFSQGDFWKFQA